MHVFIMYINFPLCASNFTPLYSENVQRLCHTSGILHSEAWWQNNYHCVLEILKELKPQTCSIAIISFLHNGSKLNLFEELIVGFTRHSALWPLYEAAGFRTTTIDLTGFRRTRNPFHWRRRLQGICQVSENISPLTTQWELKSLLACANFGRTFACYFCAQDDALLNDPHALHGQLKNKILS
jgi:hypothetical protein